MIRVFPDDFEALPLEVHSFLEDVPLHDVFAIDLPERGQDVTLAEVFDIMKSVDFTRPNWLVSVLFKLRTIIGRGFGLDRPINDIAEHSFLNRVKEEHLQQSVVAPGTMAGPFRILYMFPNESLSEIRNATVHAFLCNVLLPRESGYRFYWAVYVKAVSWVTPLYMSLIDPFRRAVVYPAMLDKLRSLWISMPED